MKYFRGSYVDQIEGGIRQRSLGYQGLILVLDFRVVFIVRGRNIGSDVIEIGSDINIGLGCDISIGIGSDISK